MGDAASSVASSGSRLIESDDRTFRENFNRSAFAFSHHLAGHPLFELPRLLELAKGLPEGDLYFDAGDVRIDQRWDQTPVCQMSIEQLVHRISDAGAWIILKRAHRDPEYGALLDRCLAEAESLIGVDFREQIKVREAIVFITSPNRVATYHIDRECNFLMQIRGEKEISIFDRYDRTILPEEEIERFWTVDHNAAVYKEKYQERAEVFALKPGVGVHIPVNAPHWVRNADNISVTLSVNFQFRDSVLANIYRANYLLRKVGIVPVPPGRSELRDSAKASAMELAIGLRKAWKRLRPA